MAIIIPLKNISKPAPRWFRITNDIISYSENFVLGILMLKGHQEDSFLLLAIKLTSSFVRNVLRAILTGNEVYTIEIPDDKQKAA